MDRYLVISADGHAGASLYGYRPYLASEWHDEFDAWASSFVNPWGDLEGPTAYRNWDTDRRLAELDSDGVVAEVLFPNTIPPFFPSGNLLAPLPGPQEYERRWAGVQAHNRWLADFCAHTPGRSPSSKATTTGTAAAHTAVIGATIDMVPMASARYRSATPPLPARPAATPHR